MMSSEKNRKLALLENLVNNQKHVIELLSMLNSNVNEPTRQFKDLVEELILDIKDIKNNQKFDNNNNSGSTSSSSDLQMIDHINLKNDDLLLNNCDQATLHHNHSSNSSSINNRQIDNNHSESIHSHHYQQAHKSLDSNDSIHIDSHNSNGLSDSVAHNGFHKSNSSARVQSTNPSNDSYKTIKTGLREFSTFVSKMVRQEFGNSFLAMTRINELDRYVMQKIRDEAIAKYLPYGISPQFAWNHAMNSLRQLRHRQCKKAKVTLKTVYVSD